jgi:uncharacterized membrane protein YqaE (UPF0057 family)
MAISKARCQRVKVVLFWRRSNFSIKIINNETLEIQMDNKLVLIILSLLIPPVAVFLKKGAGKDLIINIVLCFFFWVPGIIHALWLTMS